MDLHSQTFSHIGVHDRVFQEDKRIDISRAFREHLASFHTKRNRHGWTAISLLREFSCLNNDRGAMARELDTTMLANVRDPRPSLLIKPHDKIGSSRRGHCRRRVNFKT